MNNIYMHIYMHVYLFDFIYTCTHICFRRPEVVRSGAGIQVVGNQPGFSARTPGTFDHWAICPAQFHFDIQNSVYFFNLENSLSKWKQFNVLTSRGKLKIIVNVNMYDYFLFPKAATMFFSSYELSLVFFFFRQLFHVGDIKQFWGRICFINVSHVYRTLGKQFSFSHVLNLLKIN